VHPDDPRTVARDRVLAVVPVDDREAADRAEILEWIDSGAPLFRTVRPVTPPKHLAVYFALVDDDARCVMLVDHLKAQAWLLPGGHVDDGEDPRWSVEREAFEELQITPKFHERLGGGQPLFLSITQTRGMNTHTDVTLWFALEGDVAAEIRPDPLHGQAQGHAGQRRPGLAPILLASERSLDFFRARKAVRWHGAAPQAPGRARVAQARAQVGTRSPGVDQRGGEHRSRALDLQYGDGECVR
jgi:8-oxo-dGTP diphosphatase